MKNTDFKEVNPPPELFEPLNILNSSSIIDHDNPFNDSFKKPSNNDFKTIEPEFIEPDYSHQDVHILIFDEPDFDQQYNFLSESLDIDNSFSESFDTDEFQFSESTFNPDTVKFDSKDLTKQLALDVKNLFENIHDPFLIKHANGPVIHIGIDSEFYSVINQSKNVKAKPAYSNVVLSCQAYLNCDGLTSTYIYYPKSDKYKDRITFKKFISNVIQKALKEGVIEELPSMIFVYAHFLRADLPSFKNFWKFKDELSGIGGTVASLMKPYAINIEDQRKRKFTPEPMVLNDKNRHTFKCFVKFIDTMLHTPGRAGLAVAGGMIGVDKLPIPDGYSIERMDELLANAKDAFEAYAMRDAEIACEYGLYLQQFIRFELGLKNLPPTIGSCAVAAFRNILKDLIEDNPELDSFGSIFGISIEKEEYWHVNNGRMQTRTIKRTSQYRANHKDFVSGCYYGGRNEGIYTGPTPEDTFVDLDLRGAYTIGLTDLFTLDYQNIRTSYNVDDYLGHVAGYAHIKFEFPANVRFPCLPVSAGNRGLIFPLSGESYCTAAEIQVAVNLGCSIKIIHGVVVPWAQQEVRLFQPFVEKVRLKRNEAQRIGDKSTDGTWKEIGNTLYGKLAQGLKNKNAFDTATGQHKKISESSVTNEFFAAHVTGFVRAVIAELMNSIPDDKLVVSVTTDGFLSNASIDDLNLDQPLSQRYQALCNSIDGKPMLEEKSRATQIIGMKTRGQLTAKTFEDKPPILAKAGVKPSVEFIASDSKDEVKRKHNSAMLDLYLNRRFDDPPISSTSLIPLSEMWLLESDLVSLHRKVRVSLEYDFKRQPVNPHMMPVFDTEHLAFDSKPWHSIEEFMKVRAIFDGFRRSGNLKTLDDWYNWEDYYQTKLISKGCGMNINAKGSVDILRRVFLRAISRECWGLEKNKTNNEIALWLTSAGYETNIDELKNAKRAKLVEHIVPVTYKVIELLKVLLVEYPDMNVAMLFRVEDMDSVNTQLNLS